VSIAGVSFAQPRVEFGIVVLAYRSGGACQRLHQEEGVSVRRFLVLGWCLAATLALATPARAADFTWSFTSGGLGAQAVFHDLGGGQLQITLTNTGTGDVVAPSDVLSALLFNCSCGTLVPVSAITSGPVVLNGGTVFPTNTNVGGEWAYGTGTTRVITSMGAFNGIGQPNFNGNNLQDPASLDGIEFGIVPSTENGVGNGGIITQDLIQHDVVFVLSGFNGNLNFTDVSFQYGTSLDEPNFGGGTGTGSGGGSGQTLVPEPTSLLLFGSGLAMTAYRARRKKQQKDS
jgi:hypothetical protein